MYEMNNINTPERICMQDVFPDLKFKNGESGKVKAACKYHRVVSDANGNLPC